MDDSRRLATAESLIKSYYEISKIRNDAERIRQFIKIDSLLKNYCEQEIVSREDSHLRLSFIKKLVHQAGFKVFRQHEIIPVAGQKEDLLKFTQELERAMAYPSFKSRKDGEDC